MNPSRTLVRLANSSLAVLTCIVLAVLAAMALAALSVAQMLGLHFYGVTSVTPPQLQPIISPAYHVIALARPALN